LASAFVKVWWLKRYCRICFIILVRIQMLKSEVFSLNFIQLLTSSFQL
jgi:hypothetical protein